MADMRIDIVNTLHRSKRQGLTIQFTLRHESGQFTTTVENIIGDIIMVKPVLLPGVSLPRTAFYIDEIESVRCPRILFNAPLYTTLAHIRENIRSMHEKISRSTHELIEHS